MTSAGGWIRTYTGGRFYPLSPSPVDVDIRDIAHSLATKCRYGGHCQRFYSVGEHSVRVSYHCGKHALAGLLHDADEAYSPFGDIPRPVKAQLQIDQPELAAYIKRMGDDIRNVVYMKYGLAPDEPPEVKAADDAILVDEIPGLMVNGGAFLPKGPGLGEDLTTPWDWEYAEMMFLSRFHCLTEGKWQTMIAS